MDRPCVLIDDLSATYARLTPQGRVLFELGIAQVREAAVLYAQRRAWHVVSHHAFEQWIASQLADSDVPSVVLDPLIDASKLRAQTFRIMRIGPDASYMADPSALQTTKDTDAQAKEVVIVDDAAATGGTVRYVCRLLAARGIAVRSVILCSATRESLDILRRTVPKAEVKTFVAGDCRVLHLRDGCPYLPLSGRLLIESRAGSPLSDMRLTQPSHAIIGSLWQSLIVISELRGAMNNARTNLLNRLSSDRGSEATIGSLHKSQPDARVWCSSLVPASVTHDTRLESLLSAF